LIQEKSMQTAQRIMHFQESVIRKMTRLATEHQAINLSQGFPDFDPPLALKEAAAKAVMDGSNQYSPTWGYPPLRQKLAEQQIHAGKGLSHKEFWQEVETRHPQDQGAQL
jgi:aspartate/methionine/tyrosine aminotransferase